MSTDYEREARGQLEREQKQVRRIADELATIADGLAYIEDGEITYYDEEPEDAEDLEQASIYDYLEDVYNVRYILDADRDYLAVRVMVACGGPNIWLDSETENVELYWGSDHVSCPLSCEAVSDLDEWGREALGQQ